MARTYQESSIRSRDQVTIYKSGTSAQEITIEAAKNAEAKKVSKKKSGLPPLETKKPSL